MARIEDIVVDVDETYIGRAPSSVQCSSVVCGARCLGPHCGWDATAQRCVTNNGTSSDEETTPSEYDDGVCAVYNAWSVSCNATFPSIETSAQCAAAATSVGLPDTTPCTCIADNSGSCVGQSYTNLPDSYVEGLPFGYVVPSFYTVTRHTLPRVSVQPKALSE